MAVTNAEANWTGNLLEGNGSMMVAGNTLPFTFLSRFEPENETDRAKTNPEELIGAAIAGCFSMYLSSILSRDNFVPENVHTRARVVMSAGPTISEIALTCVANVPGIDSEAFAGYVERAHKECPVSKALSTVGDISVSAELTE